ncbi:GDSL esterase/lipase EXL3 [Capsicum galapagoense]
MKFHFFKLCSFLVLSISLPFCYAISIPPNESIPAVFVFGDSIVDTGNNNGLKTIAKVNYPPYGRDFMGGIPTGRFSNGKVPSDFLVEELGIKELLPAYLDPTLQAQDLITGVNFASGGAGYDPLTSEIAKVISLDGQLILFKEYIVKLTAIVGEDRKNEILANSLFMIVTGSNDITNTYFGLAIRRSSYDVSSYADLLVNSASSFVQVIYTKFELNLNSWEYTRLYNEMLFIILKDLYGLGAHRIGVFGIPPIGCLPSQRTLKGGEERKCVDYLNQAAQLFNSKLAAYLSSSGNKLPNSRLVYIDIYDLPLDVINNPQKYGFKYSDKGCCGTGKIEVAELCTYTCSSDSDYVFWDSFHLTEKAYKLLAHEILVQHLSGFF